MDCFTCDTCRAFRRQEDKTLRVLRGCARVNIAKYKKANNSTELRYWERYLEEVEWELKWRRLRKISAHNKVTDFQLIEYRDIAKA